MIMETPSMKDLFLETVARAKEKYDFSVENFCIMGNHFHMIIQPRNGANLSAIMQWIMSVFAMRWNRVHNKNPVEAYLVLSPDDWRHGGLWHLRRGVKDIIDGLPDWLLLLLPRHRPLELEFARCAF
jgi:REP element-mobilizing transposase RayT